MSTVYVCLAILMFFLPSVYGLLTDNGTCTNGTITIGNETQILNESAADFIKNLTTDNLEMAEIFCEAILN